MFTLCDPLTFVFEPKSTHTHTGAKTAIKCALFEWPVFDLPVGFSCRYKLHVTDIGIYTYLFPYLLFCGLSIVMLLLYHILLKHQSCCAASVECCGSESSKSWSIHRCRPQRQTAMKSNWGCSIIIVWCLPADKSTTLYALDAEFRDPNARYHGAVNTYSANRMKSRQFDWWPFCFASGVRAENDGVINQI